MSETEIVSSEATVALDQSSGKAAATVPSHPDCFVNRHIGPDRAAIRSMTEVCGYPGLDELISAAAPDSIRSAKALQLPNARSEMEALKDLREMAMKNTVRRSFIGMGYHDCVTPAVIQRNILENPGWYTQYTPYQAEISQGRLEALLTFQTMVCDLTGMDIANASLLDEATAAAEAMTLCFGAASRKKGDRDTFFVSEACHPQTIEVIETRALPLGINVQVGNHEELEFSDSLFGALVQYPDTLGRICDFTSFTNAAHESDVMVVVAADLLSLALLKAPGEFGADVAVGSAQRFGVPLGYGGPHAAFFATNDAYKRQMPGRIVGVSKDANGRPAYRLSLQTREQHIRRDKATSNICTAQALLANMAAMYAVYHGPQGIRQIAERVHALTLRFCAGLRGAGLNVGDAPAFDTVAITMDVGHAEDALKAADAQGINLRQIDGTTLGVSLDECTNESDVDDLLSVFGASMSSAETEFNAIPDSLRRSSAYLTHSVFNRYHSETEMLRYLRRLESRDLSLTSSMIPLGSCTMKLNASSEMFPVSWPEFAKLHPFAPLDQAVGYSEMFGQLEEWLAEITGFAATSLQPNAGSQGEYAGLLAIAKLHESRGHSGRNICLIPMSAHGTNPASAVMAGMQVKPVTCDDEGNIDVEDLKAKAEAHGENLAALMVTYPSTHGVFEESIKTVCQIIHDNGGLVYMDGANLNAQVGICKPAEMGADVCHINLHKTFCIPHGGGGPGMGPICSTADLAPHLPGHSVVGQKDRESLGAVSAAPWGSSSILTISWMYIAMMGGDGLTQATKVAILNANYIAKRLEAYFPVLYKAPSGLVAHECILDLRQYKSVTVEDVAKRLMDYGFHAPTISWPVAGTMMVEPTESESREELDRFCNAMISIHAEIQAVESGEADAQSNLLKNAPHTAEMLVANDWSYAYSREDAAFPQAWLRTQKFWPPVRRIDNVYGDRNLVCSCEGMEAYDD